MNSEKLISPRIHYMGMENDDWIGLLINQELEL